MPSLAVRPPGVVIDTYAYNLFNPLRFPENLVGDARVSCAATLDGGDGYVELNTTKYEDKFHARLYADGRVTLEHSAAGRPRERWGAEFHAPAAPRNVHLALGVADYRAFVEINGRRVIMFPQ